MITTLYIISFVIAGLFMLIEYIVGRKAGHLFSKKEIYWAIFLAVVPIINTAWAILLFFDFFHSNEESF